MTITEKLGSEDVSSSSPTANGNDSKIPVKSSSVEIELNYLPSKLQQSHSNLPQSSPILVQSNSNMPANNPVLVQSNSNQLPNSEGDIFHAHNNQKMQKHDKYDFRDNQTGAGWSSAGNDILMG